MPTVKHIYYDVKNIEFYVITQTYLFIGHIKWVEAAQNVLCLYG